MDSLQDGYLERFGPLEELEYDERIREIRVSDFTVPGLEHIRQLYPKMTVYGMGCMVQWGGDRVAVPYDRPDLIEWARGFNRPLTLNGEEWNVRSTIEGDVTLAVYSNRSLRTILELRGDTVWVYGQLYLKRYSVRFKTILVEDTKYIPWYKERYRCCVWVRSAPRFTHTRA